MLRGGFLVFIAGWLVWFWMDKPDPQQSRFPQSGDSLVADLQQGFDMLQAGYGDLAFIFLWHAHSIILSLLGGAVLAVIYGSVSDLLGRRRMRRLMFPQRGVADHKGVQRANTESESNPSDPV
jgi:hypothetical protein